MGVIDIFSKRRKRENGELPDIFVYDNFSEKLRTQIVFILEEACSNMSNYIGLHDDYYINVHYDICKEYGKNYLVSGVFSKKSDLLHYIKQTKDVEEILDIVELLFQNMNACISEYSLNTSCESYIEELNVRFKENSVGYALEGNQIIRVDSNYAHSNITKTVLNLLLDPKFSGANEEYLTAHEHYRHGRNKECLTECLKAFESTMKIICKEKAWEYDITSPAKKLIQVCFQNQLVPTYTQNQFTSLQNLLESGVPTIRNKLSGHGQGSVPQQVDDEMTRYALNLTGSNIIFLVGQSAL